MFGYVLPDKPNMFIKDYTVYKAFYCGLCKSIGNQCGQLMRFSTNYDITFLNIFYHSLFDIDVEYSNETCILNPIKKKSIVKTDELTQIIIDINTILMHYKCIDDVIDNNSFTKNAIDKLILRQHYKKASVNLKKIDKIINDGYNKLRQLEKENCASIDRVSDPFGNLMKEIAQELFKDKYSENIGEMMYALGKWIYLMDAIDDVNEDHISNRFNVLLINYNYTNRQKFLDDNKDTLEFILMNCYNTIYDNFSKISLKKYEGVLTNILWYGVLRNTKEILRRTEKCKKIRI